MNKLQKKLSVSIVNFNGGDFLLHCLDSLIKSSEGIELDIWVVDNASSDGSLIRCQEKYPELNYIKNTENLGFGKAHNLALKKITNEYILILNPDCEILPNTLPFMLDFLEKDLATGVATCKIELMDGSLDWASHRGFPTPLASILYFLFGMRKYYNLTDKDLTQPHEVDAISGAFFMTRRRVLDKVGLFDEDYFMYAEDIDLCYRVKRANYKIMFVPSVSVLHHKGVLSGIKEHSQEISTSSQQSRKKAFNAFYETMIIFYKKHMQEHYPFFINWLILLGIHLKWNLAKRSMKV